MRNEVDFKERELRKLRDHIQTLTHQHQSEISQIKLAKQQELDIIEDKIKQALAKKNDAISTLSEEVKLREMQIDKLKSMLEKQRKELLLK